MNLEAWSERIAQVRAALTLLPDWASILLLLGAAILIALIAHSVLVAVVRRLIVGRAAFARGFLLRARGPTRLALVVGAVAIALQAADVEGTARFVLTHVLLIMLVALLGWIGLIAIELGASAYLRHFAGESQDSVLFRKHRTQVRILRRAAETLVILVTIAAALMTFEPVRQYGVSLFASAGLAGIVAGLAARPVLSNLFAGVQIAVTQPIRIDDALIVEGEFGTVEEITGTYVVLKLWDLRRLIVPLSYFIEKPFQNWTRDRTELIGTVMLHADYAAPVEAIRAKVKDIVSASPLWDGKTASLQVVEATEKGVQLRATIGAPNSSALWDLRCELREKLIGFLQQEHPDAFPRQRGDAASKTAELGKSAG